MIHPNTGKKFIEVSIFKRNETITTSIRNVYYKSKEKEHLSTLCIFQPKISISTTKNFEIYNKLDRNNELALIYKNRVSYGVGHNCSINWNTNNNIVSNIYSTYMPAITIPNIVPRNFETFKNDKLFNEQRSILVKKYYSAKFLSEAKDDEIIEALNFELDNYKTWLDALNKEKENNSDNTYSDFKDQIKTNISQCETAKQRIESAISFLQKDKNALIAFKLMNETLYLSFLNEGRNNRLETINTNTDPYHWRSFQLCFILLSLESTIIPNHQDRNIADLLWFPTGGGKTECYNGLMLIYIFYQRLTKSRTNGVCVIMRYTLKLLGFQQFQRTSKMIIYAEKVRKDKIPNSEYPISIGYFVGGSFTPNKRSEMKNFQKKSFNTSDSLIYHPIEICPYCENKIDPSDYITHDEMVTKIICSFEKCPFNSDDGLPIYYIDEDIFQILPSVLIGTIDKYAQIPKNENYGRLFGHHVDKNLTQGPGLIIQDEFHLISGALGSIIGIYETLIDGLLTNNNETQSKPKIIASSATLSGAKDHVKSIFNRDTYIFHQVG